jgi:hypothetical protein
MLTNRSLRAKQRGVTMIGWIFLLIPMAMVVYAGIRLVPVYLNYSRVAKSLNQIADEAGGDGSATADSLRVALDKRLDIEGVEFPTIKEFTIKRSGAVWIMEVNYEESIPYISNVSLLTSFKKSVQVGKGAVGE